MSVGTDTSREASVPHALGQPMTEGFELSVGGLDLLDNGLHSHDLRSLAERSDKHHEAQGRAVETCDNGFLRACGSVEATASSDSQKDPPGGERFVGKLRRKCSAGHRRWTLFTMQC